MHAEFGIRLPVSGPLANPRNIADEAKKAEELGFRSVWSHDYVTLGTVQDRTHISCSAIEAYKDNPKPIMYESLSTLSYVAAITKNVKLGIAVLIVPIRNPIIAAKQAANVDLLSGGRLILGIGPGGIKDKTKNQDFENMAISRSEKYSRLKEYVEAMKVLWTQDLATYHGKYVDFTEAEMFPKPVQKPYPPLWLGGFREKSLTLTAELADGWIPPVQSHEEYRARKEWIIKKAEEFGRNPKNIKWAIEIFACIDEKSEDAWRVSGKTVESIIQGYPIDRLEDLKKAIIVGSADEVHNRVEAYVNAGCEHFEFKFIYHTIEGLNKQLELFSDKVMPSFH